MYSPAPGDLGDLCSACRRLRPNELPKQSGGTSPRPTPGQPVRVASVRPVARGPLRADYVKGRALRRIAIGTAVALLVAGLGVAISNRRQAVSDAWNSIRHHTPSEAWTYVQRHASEAWIAIRSHTPFDGPQVKRGTSAAPATPPSHGATREGTATRGTHRRAQLAGGARRGSSAARQNGDDMSSTP